MVKMAIKLHKQGHQQQMAMKQMQATQMAMMSGALPGPGAGAGAPPQAGGNKQSGGGQPPKDNAQAGGKPQPTHEKEQ